MWGLVKGLFGLGQVWMEGKQKKQAAKDDRESDLIRNNASWEQIQAKGSQTSWKDEWFTVVLTIPLVLVFFPSMVDDVQAGFTALSTLPEWYQYLLGLAVGASFGVKGVGGIITKLKGKKDA